MGEPHFPSSIDLKAIARHAQANLLVLDEGEPLDPWGRLPKAASSGDAFEFRDMFEKGFAKWTNVPPIMRHVVDVAIGKTGISSRLLCSNALIRQAAAHSMIDVVSRHWNVSKQVPGRRWFFVTVMGDSGNMLEYQPEMNLEAYQATVLQIIADSGLQAIGATEFQAITNFPQGGNGRTIMTNSHFIAWTDRPEFDVLQTERRLRATSPLTHWLGAKTVRIDPVQPNHRHIAWKAHYMMKAPIDGKFFGRNENTPSGWGLGKTAIRSDLAVRLMETLSQLEFPQLVQAVGDGSALRDKWLEKLQVWHEQRLSQTAWPRDDEMAEVWAWLHSRKRRGKPRQPFNLSVPIDVPSKWQSAAEEAMQEKTATRRHSIKRKR